MPQDPGLYRPRALERLSSPERLDLLLELADRRSWLPLATLASLVALLVAWSIFGSVPINVQGPGILIHPRTVVEIQAPGEGHLRRLLVRVGDTLEAGQWIAELALPEVETRLALEREKARELTALGRAIEILRLRSGDPAGGAGDVENHIRQSRNVADELRREELEALATERGILEQQVARARALADSLERRWRAYRALHADGLVAEQELLDAEAAQLDSLTRLSELETRLLELRTRRLEIDDRHLARLQRLTDLRLDLQDHEQQLGDVQRAIAALEARLEQEGRIVAERAGTIVELHAAPGQLVTRGQRIGAMSLGDPTHPLESVVYFQVRDGKRVQPGDPIRITPDTVERARFGGIEGSVRSVSDLPVTVDEAAREIGNREIAAAIVGSGHRIQVLAALAADPSTPTGLRWSSSRGPQGTISPGTTATARIAVEHRRPIAFVLPALRSTSGVD